MNAGMPGSCENSFVGFAEERLELLRQIAIEHGGRLLSTEYLGNGVKLLWQCKELHKWEAVPYSILDNGSWCRKCSYIEKGKRRKAEAFERVKLIARKKGGECLAAEYIDSHVKMPFRCRERHEWMAEPVSISNGTWCPKCAGTERLTIERMRALAAERGGECLATEYVNVWEPLRWRCREGHEWSAPANRIIHNETWCGECARRSTMTLDELRLLAEKNEGELLSEAVTNNRGVYRWRCKVDHEFDMSAHDVKKGNWCPRCYARLPYGIERLHQIAFEHGGELLSKRLVNAHTKLKWRCVLKHVFFAIPSSITKGHWCPKCAHRPGKNVTPLSIMEMQAIAEERGGRVVSTEYVNIRTPLEWECALLHRWWASPGSVKHNRSWCPECAQVYPGTIDGMRRLAIDRGGRLLSDRYDSQATWLEVECGAAHRFEAQGMALKSGVWCPHCVSDAVPAE
jgi:hypothetical protein